MFPDPQQQRGHLPEDAFGRLIRERQRRIGLVPHQSLGPYESIPYASRERASIVAPAQPSPAAACV
jgi:hypothetical protein